LETSEIQPIWIWYPHGSGLIKSATGGIREHNIFPQGRGGGWRQEGHLVVKFLHKLKSGAIILKGYFDASNACIVTNSLDEKQWRTLHK